MTTDEKLSLNKSTNAPKNKGEQVRQSFSHGRSKSVSVEVKKKWTPKSSVLSKKNDDQRLTNNEQENRFKALQESLKKSDSEIEARQQRDEQHRRLHEENQKKIDLVEQRKQEEIDRQEALRVAKQAREQAVKPPFKKNNERSNQSSPQTNSRPPKPSAPSTSSVPSHKIADSKPAFDDVLGTTKPSLNAHLNKTKKPNFGGDDESSPKKENRNEVKTAPAKDHNSNKRLSRQFISSALQEEEGGRRRSMASIKRARQKDRNKGQHVETVKIFRDVIIPDTITVQELSNRMAVRGGDVVKFLMKNGMLVTINQVIDAETAELICAEFGHSYKRASESDVETDIKIGNLETDVFTFRAPVVTVMGHVDHGKTSLLDALRRTDVVSGEAGGITQHIGAYQVTLSSGKKITFIDTPGHAAFTEMRSRGAQLTDIVVLVVAADDGIMDQTIEAIRHAKAANVPMIIAINKCDKPDANPDRVRSELLTHEVVLEEFGGDVLSIEVSARTGMNLDKLEEAILLQAEILDLKAAANRQAEGVVIEAKLDRGRGTVATVLVQKGTLKRGDIFVAGTEWGKIRALVNDHGTTIEEALPSMAVEVIGFNGVPEAGDEFIVVNNEAKAREVAEYRQLKVREAKVVKTSKSHIEQMMSDISMGTLKELPIVIKADVHGSLEAISASLTKIGTSEVAVKVLHGAVGAINESDVTLARASNALVIGFNVRANNQARDLAMRDGIDIQYYSIIYDIIDKIKGVLGGLLAPTLREKYLGQAQIRNVFNITKVGKIAGCFVTEGLVKRGSKVRLLRDNVVIHTGELKTLKRFKDEVKEVKENYECGMAFENYNDIREGDSIECFEIEEIARSL
jgi:translation initiation factor IF-2